MANILLIDDSDYQRGSVALIIKQLNHTVFEASDGRSGLNLILKQPLDCIFTDIHMPEMDGLTLLKALQDKDNKIPIIVLTADAKPETVGILRNLGAKGFLAKPAHEKNIIKILNALLNPKDTSKASNS